MDSEINSPEQTAERLIAERLVDISSGIPGIYTAQELSKSLYYLFRRNITRLPIIGVDNKVYMLVVTKSEQPDHRHLYQELGSPAQLDFTTSIELQGLPDEEKPSSFLALHLEGEGYIAVGKGSDTLQPLFTQKGQEKLNQIFSVIPGVTLES